MGSLCCVAARPHGSNAASRDWSMGPHEPYWQTNTSFSPPLSRGWERRFQIEGLPHGPQGGVFVYGSSSISSDSKGSGISVVDDHFRSHSASDGSYFSSLSDSFHSQPWIPNPTRGVIVDDYTLGTTREPGSGRLAFTPSMEGTSMLPYSVGSTSSRSDGSEYEAVLKTRASSNCNFSSRRSFKSKPIHPISVPNHSLEQYASGTISTGNYLSRPTPSEAGSNTPQRETLRLSSSSSIDFTDVSEYFDSESVGPSYNLLGGFQCGLCDKFLSQRSPWSSRRIVRSGDMPVAGVLSCRHVFHADCLEQTTPNVQKQDPPCPLCAQSENAPEQLIITRLKNESPRLRQLGEDGSTRFWSCGQVDDCVEGAVHASPRSNMLLLNRSHLKKHLSFKGGSSKELSDKLKKSGSFSLQVHNDKSVEHKELEISNLTAGSTLKRW